MNSLLKKFLFVSVLTFALMNSPFAQQIEKSTAIVIHDATGNTEAKPVSNDLVISNSEMSGNLMEYPKVIKRFSILYPDPNNPQWTEINNVLFVSFTNNGNKTRACFTKDGKMNYAITDCHLPQLPEELKQHITTKYPGYTVFNAIEINAYNKIAHQVILEDATGFITLKSTDEGIDETSKVSK